MNGYNMKEKICHTGRRWHTCECPLGYVPELSDPVYMKPNPLHAYNPHFDIFIYAYR